MDCMKTLHLYDRFHEHTGNPIAAAILALAETIKGSQPESLTSEQAARLLGCQPKTIRTMCADGRLRHHRIGTGRGSIRILREDLDRHLFVSGTSKPIS